MKNHLFTVGPVNINQDVKNSLSYNEIGHREKEFEDLLFKAKTKLLKVFKGNNDFEVVIISSSGTAAMESVISSCVDVEKKVLTLSNGRFGERFDEIAKVYGIETINLNFVWGKEI